ncbi:MAG: hypothetical protein AAFP85_17595 [Pseudomonadota bacterium]
MHLNLIASTAIALVTLTACSSGGGGGGAGGDEVPQSLDLFFGSTDPNVSRSGLDYADGTQDLDDLEGQAHTVRLIRLTRDGATGEATQSTSDETLIMTPNGNDDDFTITLDGETIAFADGASALGDGTPIFGGAVSPFTSLDNVEILSVSNSGTAGTQDGEITLAILTSGFETAPDNLTQIAGSVFYTGAIAGVTDTTANLPSFGGEFLLVADFASGMIDGNATLTGVETTIGTGDLDFDIAQTDITGNGFSSELTLTDCSFAACTGNGDIGGVFYGTFASEVAGIATVDVTATNDNGQTDQVGGIAAFGGTASQ